MNTPSTQPGQDQRFTNVRHLDTTYSFAVPTTRQAWGKRAKYIREQILTGAGLMPMPEKTPLNARIFGRVERDGYTIEKVYFESFPGFFVTGNLYKPRGKKGPFPAVLNTHGHWENGRLANTELGSMPARCISFARQGYIAFLYDMIGYNDSFQLKHREDLTGQREHLWGISVGGLQLWNSIRAVDFLLSLPDVDKDRIACTGESGGGTQTFMLASVDDRVKFFAPVNMISSTMQGGCVCENPPLVRLDTNNMEIAALTAPRPMLMVSATGDWTVNTPTVEFPAVRSVYKLLGADDMLAYVQMKAEHNYNKDSREAVYAFFGKWILGDSNANHFKEQSFVAEKDEDLLVFGSEPKPANALDADGIIQSRIAAAEKQIADMKPHNAASLNAFRKAFGPALMHSLAVEMPKPADIEAVPSDKSYSSNLSYCSTERFLISRKGKQDAIPVVGMTPDRNATGTAVVVGASDTLIEMLLKAGRRVIKVDCFNTGAHIGSPESADRLTRYGFYDTYNRTDTANRVQDILTVLAWVDDTGNLDLVGTGEGGLWSLLARAFAPNVRRTVVDANGFNNTNDKSFVDNLYAPSLRRAGDFRTAAALIAPGEIFIHNTRAKFQTDWFENAYSASGQPNGVTIRGTKASDKVVVGWLSK